MPRTPRYDDPPAKNPFPEKYTFEENVLVSVILKIQYVV